MNTQFSPWPSYTEEEAEAVKSVLLSNKVNYWTGTHCREFETQFAKYVGVEHAVAVANGTLALDAALAALGIGPGDEVIVPSRTFVATASSVVNAGAVPVFADVDRNSQNVTAATIEPLVNNKTRAIIVVHLAGLPCEMDDIMALAKERSLWVIEDCAQAHGAKYKGKSVGSIGHIGAWSFCQDKIMTTGGEGGMVTTNDTAMWKEVWSLKDHGKSWDKVYNEQHQPGFRWLHETPGHNWRLTEMQAAIGLIQLEKLDRWVKQRQANAALINNVGKQISAVRVIETPAHMEYAAYKHYLFVEPQKLAPGWDRDRIIAKINKLGVPCFQGSCSEVYLEKMFDERMRPGKRLPVARELGEASLMFLVHPTLDADEIIQTCNAIDKVFSLMIS